MDKNTGRNEYVGAAGKLYHIQTDKTDIDREKGMGYLK